MWAFAIAIIVILAVVIGLVILAFSSLAAKGSASLQVVELKATNKAQAQTIEKLKTAIDREKKARTVLHKKFNEVHRLVLTHPNKRALPMLLTDFFKSHSEDVPDV